MKKILTTLVAALCTLGVFADDIVVTSDLKNGAYVEGAVQIGATTNINVYIVAEKTIASALQCDIYLPEGLTAESGKSTVEDYGLTFTPHPELGNCVRLIWANTQVGTIDAQTPLLAAKIAVSASSTLSSGDVQAKTNNLDFAKSYNNETDNFVSSIKVQKTAVIEEQDAEFALEVTPFVMTKGGSYDSPVAVNVMMKNAKSIYNASFTMTLPEGLKIAQKQVLNDDDEYVTSYKKPSLESAHMNAAYNDDDAVMAVTQKVSGNTVTYKFTSDGDAAFKKSVYFSTAFTIYLQSDASIEDGVYNVSMKDIKLSNTSNDYTGGYYFSTFVGTPTETDPILYGHYTEDIISTLNGGVAKNFCTIDMSAATVDEGCKVNDALVYTADKTTYDRSITTTYGTVCLPIEATGTFYTLSAATADKLTFTPLEGKLPANTPAIFSGAISAAAEGTVTPGTPGTGATANGLTLTGTYKTFELADGAGYFISKDKFYNDGATVKAFRSYFTGTISSGAKALRIEIEDANGVRDITDQLSDQDIFNLQGIRVQTAKKGVNIINGKKVYVK